MSPGLDTLPREEIDWAESSTRRYSFSQKRRASPTQCRCHPVEALKLSLSVPRRSNEIHVVQPSGQSLFLPMQAVCAVCMCRSSIRVSLLLYVLLHKLFSTSSSPEHRKSTRHPVPQLVTGGASIRTHSVKIKRTRTPLLTRRIRYLSSGEHPDHNISTRRLYVLSAPPCDTVNTKAS